MRIAHVITRLIIGGAQENTLLTVKGQMDLGHEVSLVTGPTAGPEGDLYEQARRWGVDLFIIDDLCREISPRRDAAAVWKLYRWFRRRRPDVVHTHSSKAGILARAAARLAHAPVIVHTVHGMSFGRHEPRWRNGLFRILERTCARWTDRIVTVCDAMIEQSVAGGVARRGKFLTVYSGMEVDPFIESASKRDQVRRRYGFDDDHVVVGKIARLFEFKGHDDVLLAAAKVAERAPEVRFLFVGDGILKEDLEKMAERLGVRERIVFAGLLPPREIPETIAAMDLAVHTSLREGLARVLPQALLSEKPVIAYDLDGTPEVLLDGRTGILIGPRDTDALADAIVRLARDPEERARMGKLGRQLFRDQFSYAMMARRLEGLYHAILAERTTRE